MLLAEDNSTNSTSGSINKLAQTHLRMDFFRLHPNPQSEVHLTGSLRDRLGSDSIVIFKALGHYDLICIYTGFEERQALFQGSIHGIRSFSTIDCVCWENAPAQHIINLLNKAKVLAINIATLRPESLSAHGGVYNDLVSAILSSEDIQMTSFSWGEQVILSPDTSLNKLWGRSASLNGKLEPLSLDIHSLIGINLATVENLESSSTAWEEHIADNLVVEWNVDLKCSKTGASKEFSKRLTQTRRLFKNDFRITRSKHLLSPTQLVYRLSGSNWGSIIRGIRYIRSHADDLLIASKLQIYQKSK